MFKPKAYKSMLAASVLTAVMGTGSVFAAEVQAGYTPDLNSTTTTNAATTNDAATTQAVYNADATTTTIQDETDAAILAARGDTTISSDGTVVNTGFTSEK